MRPRPAKTSDAQLAAAWQVASLLLGYPDEELLGRRPLLRRAVAGLPAPVAEPLGRVLDHLDATAPQDLAADYVATFDHRKRCCLYLTYYAYGDTRKRGMALLRFKQAYDAAGLVLDGGELPDHLAVVLEFAATGDLVQGRRLLLEHRAGLELLRLSLTESGSPWAPVLDAIAATLPPLTGRTEEAVARLIAEGPPEEEVGLAPYGADATAMGPVLLPDPVVGARS
ncbi:nitrate reductase molybdenum cofactor assembly chaperone [Actinomadura madurae]|uniref:nitrate reductase molybdenum cofactor assembly chaperone n=1 Tax=Actinomadura madurae TaxID=1993 RepID=UPI0020262BD1|nr:nitrate reductase molybdenum cofactor assembly chaperone [Actinomadura madurae]MCP9949606.1 nitrate reductase molybdenum cofactor assembly chaperone [Actinomadura madurae]MCP9966360.1 nitrate reductase molybdenum cofactor assembly chaperone [Actinomadura madurae]MCQ0009622.1 nitrate reductase molybdenum cofactor assembly chaperone [Actinomadura madurae]MCQ0015038.1 nitrate reductase molybdenum cofactor assembly chaperone [Actinomadura madurae]URN01584.1 nitrate reductase molybdenum cofactor